MEKKKAEVEIRSSAAEYLTYIASIGDQQDRIEMRYEDENIWLTQKMMAALYDVNVRTVNEHIKKIYSDSELEPVSTIRKFRIVQIEGSRQVNRDIAHYNLQMIIAVGFKVNNERAVQFRKWANQIVKDYTIKGWVTDDDRLKIGAFLKELRKEKNLTQEQLAERLHVSGRTVSRWETGKNMPDVSMLVDLAELYRVSIPEIVEGKRRSEKMKEEVKETAFKLADYAETINQKIKRRLFWLTVITWIGMLAFVVIKAAGLNTPGSLYERIASVSLGLDFGMLTVIAMYLSGALGKIKARRGMRRNMQK